MPNRFREFVEKGLDTIADTTVSVASKIPSPPNPFRYIPPVPDIPVIDVSFPNVSNPIPVVSLDPRLTPILQYPKDVLQEINWKKILYSTIPGPSWWDLGLDAMDGYPARALFGFAGGIVGTAIHPSLGGVGTTVFVSAWDQFSPYQNPTRDGHKSNYSSYGNWYNEPFSGRGIARLFGQYGGDYGSTTIYEQAWNEITEHSFPYKKKRTASPPDYYQTASGSYKTISEMDCGEWYKVNREWKQKKC